MLHNGLAAAHKHDLASVTSAMNAAATQDLRSVALTPVLTELLKAAPSPSPRAARMLAILQEWRAGGSRGSTATSTARWTRPARRSGTRSTRGCSTRRCREGPGPLIGDDSGPRAASPTAASGTSRRTCGASTAAACAAVQGALLRQRRQGQARRRGVGGARGRPGRPGRRWPTRRGADRVPARAAADQDPLHEPPERDPAGDLLQRAPASMRPMPADRYGRICSRRRTRHRRPRSRGRPGGCRR